VNRIRVVLQGDRTGSNRHRSAKNRVCCLANTSIPLSLAPTLTLARLHDGASAAVAGSYHPGDQAHATKKPGVFCITPGFTSSLGPDVPVSCAQ